MVDRVSNGIQIKGTRDGLMVTLDEKIAWETLKESLLAQMSERAAFFQGAKVVLEIGNRVITGEQLGKLKDDLAAIGISFWAVLSQSAATEESAQMLGLATRIHTRPVERTGSKSLDSYLEGEQAIFLRKTLRSGFKVASHGHIVILGDVNPGAEIIAGGSIIVWGRLRGIAHAGAEGNEDAVVCALDLSPTQLRIADYVSVSPQRKGKTQPEVAYIENQQVVAEPWVIKEH
jgi:septum site-determining protein MinC